GIGLVREVGEFVGLIEVMTGALRERVRAVGALLTSDRTMPLLVTAPEPRLVAETEALVRALGAIGLSIQGIVVNRALARATFGRGAPDPGLPDGVSGALAARLAASYGELRALGARQEATLAPLVESARAPVLAEVPLLATDPGSLADLAAIPRHPFPRAGRAAPRRGRAGASGCACRWSPPGPGTIEKHRACGQSNDASARHRLPLGAGLRGARSPRARAPRHGARAPRLRRDPLPALR